MKQNKHLTKQKQKHKCAFSFKYDSSLCVFSLNIQHISASYRCYGVRKSQSHLIEGKGELESDLTKDWFKICLSISNMFLTVAAESSNLDDPRAIWVWNESCISMDGRFPVSIVALSTMLLFLCSNPFIACISSKTNTEQLFVVFGILIGIYKHWCQTETHRRLMQVEWYLNKVLI